jgi:hypothetical protein
MIKTTKKTIKAYNAIDITTMNFDQKEKEGLRNDKTLFYSIGVYGRNAMVFVGSDGNTYKITDRTTALFMFM